MTIRRKVIPLQAVVIDLLAAKKIRLAAARQTPGGWTIAQNICRTNDESRGRVGVNASSVKVVFDSEGNEVGQLIHVDFECRSGCISRLGIVAKNRIGMRIRASVCLAFVLLLVLSGVAVPSELAGQASVIDGDTWKFAESGSAFGVSTRLRARNFAGLKIVECTIAVRRPPTNSTPSLRADLCFARRSPRISTAARLLPVP